MKRYAAPRSIYSISQNISKWRVFRQSQYGTNMNSKNYLALNHWLQKSDGNYMEGRLLWLNSFVDGASNLLWLASEQIIKILLLQKNIDTLSNQSSDLDELYDILDREGKKLGHDVHKLISNMNKEYPQIDISKYEPTLEKLQEYFNRRYAVRGGSSISLLMLDEVDELYFLLRGEIDPDVGLGTIDEIFIQKKHNWKHPLPAFAYAYLQNKHFRARKHKEITYSAFDGSGKRYVENGT